MPSFVRLACTTSFTLLAFLCTGIALAIVPSWVHNDLGYSATLTGFAVGVQYLATLFSRPLAGRLADSGVKRAVGLGLYGILASGLFALCAAFVDNPLLALLALIVSRLLLGVAQGVLGVAVNIWGIAEHGAQQTARVISWNGIAAYGGIAIGAPLGLLLHQAFGNAALGMALLATACGALLGLRALRGPSAVKGKSLSFTAALKQVLPYGVILALASIGFGTLSAFITLFFAEQHWRHAAYCLSAFGAAFVVARILFVWTIKRFGGLNAALVCLLIEVLGLVLLAVASTPQMAIVGAALTGFGLSLIYPALGVVALAKVDASGRGSALGAYGVFFDVALGLAGPLMGLIASFSGYRSIFIVAAALCATGLVLSIWLKGRTGAQQ